MTENEAIVKLEKFQLQIEHSIAEEDCCEYGNSEKTLQEDKEFIEAFDVAISALKEIQLYKDNKLCLVPTDVYSRQCSELDAYKEIGTVEECREAVEKQTKKKCAIDSCPDHTHYKCPSCGQIELSIYKHGFPRLGRITKYCENCGQALINEDLEGMEDE